MALAHTRCLREDMQSPKRQLACHQLLRIPLNQTFTIPAIAHLARCNGGFTGSTPQPFSTTSHLTHALFSITLLMTSTSEPSIGRFHPMFNDPDADIVLCSNEGTLFRIPHFTLRMTSGYFRVLLAQPPQQKLEGFTDIATDGQKSPTKHISATTTPIPVPFPDTALDRVLRMISGLETTPWASFSQLEQAVDLMVHWDTPGPLSIIRASCTSPIFLSQPLRLYALATRFDWEEVAKLASGLTLSMNLLNFHNTTAGSSEIQEQLYRLSAPALLRLLAFHRKRRDDFRVLLDSSELFNAGNATHYYCAGCGEEVDNSSWRELKARMVWEMDQCASGETILALDMEGWDESQRCWGASCKKTTCGRVYYDKMCTMRDVKACIERLPKTI